MIFKPNLLETWIISKKGKIERYEKKLMESFVRQYADWEYSRFTGINASVKEVGGTTQSRSYAQPLRLDAPVAQDLYGIVVGTGTTAPTISDYKVQTKIAHGNGAGQLYHQIGVVNAVTLSGPSAFFTVQRNFNNNSGADITVQEVALYGYDLAWCYCLARDLTGGHVVPNTKTYVAQYTWSVSV